MHLTRGARSQQLQAAENPAFPGSAAPSPQRESTAGWILLLFHPYMELGGTNDASDDLGGGRFQFFKDTQNLLQVSWIHAKKQPSAGLRVPEQKSLFSRCIAKICKFLRGFYVFACSTGNAFQLN